MAVNYVTTIQPQGIDFYVEDVVAGAPTFVARLGSMTLVAVAGAVNYYVNTNGGTNWELMLRTPLDLATAINDAGNNLLTGGLWLRASYPAGAGPTDVALPTRTGGWRVVDAYINSGGVGGTLQVSRAADGLAISDAMIPGAADVLTRAASITLANATIASAGSVRLVGAAGTLAGVAFVRIEPL